MGRQPTVFAGIPLFDKTVQRRIKNVYPICIVNKSLPKMILCKALHFN